MVTLILSLALSSTNPESRVLAPLEKGHPTLDRTIAERFVDRTKFVIVSHDVNSDGSTSYSKSEYDNQGNPLSVTQHGFWNDRWNTFQTEFGAKGYIQSINDTKTTGNQPRTKYRNPTALWFWRTHPQKGTSETVTFLAQNTIAEFQIKFTYEDDEVMELAGRKVTLHRVREKPLSAPDAVYTIWWYDDEGMGVKRYHKTTTNEYETRLVAWK